MRHSQWFMLMAAAGTLLATPLIADEIDTANDVNCYIVYAQIASKPGKQQAPAYLGLMYWTGRLDGRTPKLDLENRIITATPKLTQERFQSEALRCGAELSARGRAITQMGEELIKREKK